MEFAPVEIVRYAVVDVNYPKTFESEADAIGYCIANDYDKSHIVVLRGEYKRP